MLTQDWVVLGVASAHFASRSLDHQEETARQQS